MGVDRNMQDIRLLVLKHSLGVDFGVDGASDSEVGASKSKRFPLIVSFSNFAPRAVNICDGD